MIFNADPAKQAQELHFSVKAKIDFQNLIFNESNVESCSFQKHLGLTLDEILNFDEFVQYKIIKCNKLIGIAKRLSLNLPHEAFLTS